MVRGAFSFIELVISIVVIGIIFMTVPLIITQTQKSVEASIHQEAVMAGLTQMVNIMSYRWDENETNESLNGGYAKILDTGTNIASLQCQEINGTRMRVGNFRGDGRRKCYNEERNATAPLSLGSEGDMDDIDDIGGLDNDLLAGNQNTNSDYKLSYTTKINVSYIDDDLTGGYSDTILNGSIDTSPIIDRSTNIKMIEVNITSETLNSSVILRAFATNVGEFSYFFKEVGP